jgi:hypothetical protein
LAWNDLKVGTTGKLERQCSAPLVRIFFLSTPSQLAAIQRKMEKEKETLEQQVERVSPGM